MPPTANVRSGGLGTKIANAAAVSIEKNPAGP
jgi:hypothetical protein